MRYIDELEYINTAHNKLCIKLLQLTHFRSPMHKASEVTCCLQKEREISQYQPDSAHYHQFVVRTGPSILGGISLWHKIREEPCQYDIVMSKQKYHPTSLFIAWLILILYLLLFVFQPG